jgi:salicylate hydroxylase
MEARRRIVIAGGGIAGLTAALAFAQRGFAVDIFEQAERIEAVGAGLQLSPNATRILVRLGVLERLLPSAVRPEAVVLRDAAALKELARVPLGSSAEQRWQAPYLTAHRADLQDALVAQAGATAGIRLVTGARITSVETGNDGVTARIERDGKTDTAQADLAVGADGVWSAMRRRDGLAGNSRFTGELAWRTTVKVESAAGRLFATLSTDGCVNAFLNPHFHLIAYPVSAGAAINLVAFTKGERIAEGWSGRGDPSILAKAMNGAAPGLRQLIDAAGPWLAWPLHAVDQRAAWTDPAGIALIGDAAHAMTPFAERCRNARCDGRGAGPLGTAAQAARRQGDPARRAQPYGLERGGAGRAGAQYGAQIALGRAPGRRSRLALWLAGAVSQVSTRGNCPMGVLSGPDRGCRAASRDQATMAAGSTSRS